MFFFHLAGALVTPPADETEVLLSVALMVFYCAIGFGLMSVRMSLMKFVS